MRILYGVTGEGLGHTMRARALAARLAAEGHELRFAASGRAVGVLRGHGLEVTAIDGFHLCYRRGGLLRARTVAENVRGAPRALRRNIDAAVEVLRAFDPQVVITDFDSFAYTVGRLLDLPILSFDHQHVLDRFRHPAAVRARVSPTFGATCALVRQKTPRCEHFVVTSFFFPEVRERLAGATTLAGPVVRPEIERAVPTIGDHVVVYQTARGDPRLIPALRAHPEVRFAVYGLGAGPDQGNVALRAFDEAGFVADLASARAVIANGGFTTLAEAIWLGKPVLSVPVRRQAEQELNAAWLAHLGLGARARRIGPRAVGAFLGRVRAGDFAPADDPRLRRGLDTAAAALTRALAEAA